MAMASKITPPVLTPEGHTSDGRYAIDVLEYAALRGLSPATAWRLVRAGRISSIQPNGRNGRVQIPVHAVLDELGIGVANREEVK